MHFKGKLVSISSTVSKIQDYKQTYLGKAIKTSQSLPKAPAEEETRKHKGKTQRNQVTITDLQGRTAKEESLWNGQLKELGLKLVLRDQNLALNTDAA